MRKWRERTMRFGRRGWASADPATETRRSANLQNFCRWTTARGTRNRSHRRLYMPTSRSSSGELRLKSCRFIRRNSLVYRVSRVRAQSLPVGGPIDASAAREETLTIRLPCLRQTLSLLNPNGARNAADARRAVVQRLMAPENLKWMKWVRWQTTAKLNRPRVMASALKPRATRRDAMRSRARR